MLHLLKIEWLKIKNYRTFWIFLVISAISIPGFNYLMYELINQMPKVNDQNLLGNPFGFPDVWGTVSYFSTMVLILPSMLLITLTTNEFSYKTSRQNIIDGLSRSQFFHVKLSEILLLSLFTTTIVAVTCLAFGFLSTPDTSATYALQHTRFLFFYFVQCLSYLMIAFMLSMIIKRAGLTIGIFFIYMIFENVIVAVYNAKVQEGHLFDYLPQETNDILIPKPLLRKIVMNQNADNYWSSHVPVYLTFAAIYLLLYYLLTSWKFRKGDL